ncbi:MAG: Poly(A) polymerase, partial [Myxococcaceae bacterium]|nr:Poly(A) polymerase [Myxococcaceae bacterium]
ERVDADAAKVVKRLTRSGHLAYLVGGGVRDLLLGQKPKDFDIATSARPHEVRALFRNCRVIGRRFRLAHVLFGGGKIIEVATFRRDPRDDDGPMVDSVEDEDGMRLVPQRKQVDEQADLLIRHDNAFGEPHEDALRRDFTCNGLFYDIERDEVIDYVGGVPDVRARLVRTIGDPAIRFREDPIRILRAIKFCARLDLGIDPEVYDAMIDQRQTVSRASPPRTFEEILRLLRGGASHRAFYLLWDTGLLSVMVPELAAYLDDAGDERDVVWKRLMAVDRHVAEGDLPNDSILLASLLQSPAEEYMEGEKDPAFAFDQFVEDMAMRFTVPRRIRERMRILLSVQKRLRDGKVGNLARREFFSDSALLYGLDCEARELPLPVWAYDVSRYVEPPPVKKNKRTQPG